MAELILHLPGIESISGSALPDPLADALCKARYAGRYSCDPLEQVLGCAPIPAPAVLSVLGQGLDPADRYWLRFDVLRMVPDLTAVWIDRPLAVDFDAPAYADLRAELAEPLDIYGWPTGRSGDFGQRDIEIVKRHGFRAALATDDDYAVFAGSPQADSLFSLRRFGFPATRAEFLNCRSWVERGKGMLTGYRGKATT